MHVFKGAFIVPVTDKEDFYTMNRRNTLENPSNHLCALGNTCGEEETKAFLNTGLYIPS